VVIFIDRQLAGPYGKDKYRYTKPPFVESMPEHGYQGKENPREVYRQGIAKLGNLADLTPAEQDQKLRAIETTYFFRMLRRHTIEGMFSDPMHGGNAGLIGWQLIGFPGPLMSYRDEIDKAHGQPWRRKPQSLAQITGRAVKGWEEEKD
jgi:gluconate 2-dehydrogenase gamma chain